MPCEYYSGEESSLGSRSVDVVALVRVPTFALSHSVLLKSLVIVWMAVQYKLGA